MTSPRDRAAAHAERFLRVVVRRRSYLNLAYLFVLFPLGIAYFTLLVTFGALSGALTVLLVGPVIFLVSVYGCVEVAAGHRWLTERLLGIDIPTREFEPPDTLKGRVLALLTDLRTWTSVVFLFSIFPIGIATFVVAVTGGSLVLATIAVPLYYDQARTGFFLNQPVSLEPSLVFEVENMRIALSSPFRLTSWYVDSLPEALVMSLFGVVLGLCVLHVFNGLAWILGQYTRLLLRDGRPSALR
jgi:hypothetical protein